MPPEERQDVACANGEVSSDSGSDVSSDSGSDVSSDSGSMKKHSGKSVPT